VGCYFWYSEEGTGLGRMLTYITVQQEQVDYFHATMIATN